MKQTPALLPHWYPTCTLLVPYWVPYWAPISTLLVAHWYPTGCLLVPYFNPFGTLLVCCWCCTRAVYCCSASTLLGTILVHSTGALYWFATGTLGGYCTGTPYWHPADTTSGCSMSGLGLCQSHVNPCLAAITVGNESWQNTDWGQ